MSYEDPKQLRLDALAAVLKGHGLSVDPIMGGLVARDAQAKVVVTCRPYQADDRKLWFFAEPDLPLADADRLTDTVVAVKGHLAASTR